MTYNGPEDSNDPVSLNDAIHEVMDVMDDIGSTSDD